MRKKTVEKRDYNPSQLNGRVLARALAEDLCGVSGGLGPTNNMLTAGVTDLGDGLDVTFRGSDGDSA
jgi:hypothetical protein